MRKEPKLPNSRFLFTIGPDGLAQIHRKDIPSEVKSESACGSGARGCRKVKLTINDVYLDFLREIKSATGTARYYIIDEDKFEDPEAKALI